jgi:hypothetical protein
MDHPIALNYTPRLTKRSLHDKLIQSRPKQLSRLLEGVLYVLRHPGRNSASFLISKRHSVWSGLFTLWSCWAVSKFVNGMA